MNLVHLQHSKLLNQMKRIKPVFQLLLLISIAFLIYYLTKIDYLIFDKIEINYLLLTVSIILLWLGFLISAISWKAALKANNIEIGTSKAIYSQGAAIFAKYIPGKIWVILGRASIVAKDKRELIKISTISLKEQLVYLVIGLLTSFAVLLFMPVNDWYLAAFFFTVAGLSLFLFSKKIHFQGEKIFEKVFRKKIEIPFVSIRQSLPYAVVLLILWLTWSVGFYLLCRSVYPGTQFIAAFIFPVSVSYGLLAIFLPGGIGVREGIMVLLLTSSGMEPAMATTISVLSRIWFITGEIFIFSAAFVAKRKQKAFAN